MRTKDNTGSTGYAERFADAARKLVDGLAISPTVTFVAGDSPLADDHRLAPLRLTLCKFSLAFSTG